MNILDINIFEGMKIIFISAGIETERLKNTPNAAVKLFEVSKLCDVCFVWGIARVHY